MGITDRLIKYQRVFILLAGLAGMLLVLYTTAPYGAGVTGDSVYYLSGAENIACGHGYIDHFGRPLVKFPPLYAYLLGGISYLTGSTPLQAGTYLNAVIFGLIAIAAGYFFRRSLAHTLWVYLGTLAALFSRSLFTLGINIFSDPLFILFVVLFLMLLQRYFAQASWKTLMMLVLVTALALLQRYIALALLLTGAFAILLHHRKEPRRVLWLGFIYCGLSSLPLAAWIVLRNMLTYGQFIGERSVTRVLFWQNTVDALQRMAYWLLPISLLDLIPLWLVAAILLLVFLSVIRREQWSALRERYGQPQNLVVLFFTVLYFILVMATTFSADHYGPYDDRYISVLYIPLFWLLFALADELLVKRATDQWQLIIVLVFALWLIFPINTVRKIVIQSRQEGVIRYNIFNTRWFHESTFIDQMQAYPFEEGIPVYSNYADTVFMYLDVTAQPALQDTHYYAARLETLAQHITDWPQEGQVYLVWFNHPTFAKRYYNPEQLHEYYAISTLYEDQDGGLYLIEKSP